MDAMEHTPDVLLLESVEKGMVHRLAAVGLLPGPTDLGTTMDSLKVVIVACGHTLIDCD
jgi:hypothetical protein